jgi:hypothetical protein
MGKRIESWKSGARMDVLRMNLSFGARLLYAILWGYKSKKSPNPWPSAKTLAQDLHCDKKTIHRLKAELARNGLIDWRRREESNIYTVFEEPQKEIQERERLKAEAKRRERRDKDVPSKRDTDVPRVGTPESLGQGQGCPLNGNHINGNQGMVTKENGNHKDWYVLGDRTYTAQQLAYYCRLAPKEEVVCITANAVKYNPAIHTGQPPDYVPPALEEA